jgi:hypothetical protein
MGGGNLRVPQHQGVREAVASLAINIGGEAADVKREVGVERSLKAGIPPGSRRDSAPLCRTRSDDVPRAYRHPAKFATPSSSRLSLLSSRPSHSKVTCIRIG